MTETPVGFGIVGCASMGETHAEAIDAVDGAELVACADHSAATAESLGAAHDCAAYADYVEMLADAPVDAVCVCTPNGTHAEIVVAAADRSVDVLCEKPLDVTPKRVDEMVAACRDADVVLAGILQRRTLPSMRFARDVVRGGELGRLLLADVEMRWHRDPSYYADSSWHGSAALDGGVLFTQALHGVDLLQWVAGDVAAVAGSVDTLSHDIEAPDTAALSVRFGNDGLGQVAATTATEPQQPITLGFHGTEGSLRVTESGIEAYETSDGPVDYSLPDPPAGGAHAEQVRDFVRAVTAGSEPMVPPESARKALDIVFAADASDARGEWIPLSEFGDAPT